MKTFISIIVVATILVLGFAIDFSTIGTTDTTTANWLSSTSTLSVESNYGEQVTAPSTVLQDAPNTVQNTATSAELQNANVCLQGC